MAYYGFLPGTAEVYGTLVEATFTLHRADLYTALRWPLPDEPEQERRAGEELTVYLWRGMAPPNLRFYSVAEDSGTDQQPV